MRKVRDYIRKGMLAVDLSDNQCCGRKAEANRQEHVPVRQTASYVPPKGDRVLVHQTSDRSVRVQTATDTGRGNFDADAGRTHSTHAGETGGRGTGQVLHGHSELSLRDIARIAFVENMTAKEAADRYGVDVKSIRKVVCRHRLPRLVTEQERHVLRQLSCMNDTQLLSYWNALCLPKNKNASKTEKDCVKKELERRSVRH